MDTPPEAAFDRIAALVRSAFGAPVSMVGFLDERRHWFKAREGVELTESPRDISFCTHAIEQDEVLWVADAREDMRFRDNPLVAAGPQVRFYAGAPVRGDGGERVGTVCVLDMAPRPYDPALAALLADLAQLATDQLELRRHRLMRNVVGSLIGSTNDAMMCADPNGRITFWNTASQAVFGWTAAEAIGQSLDLIVPERSRAAHNGGFARLIAGGSPKLIGRTVEVQAVHKSGREIPVELSLSTWGNGDQRGVGAIVRDISERKRAEEALRRSQETAEAAGRESAAAHETMGLLVRSATSPLVMTDHRLNVVEVSDRWVDLYGRPREGVVGRCMHDIFPGGRGQWAPVYQRCLQGARENGERTASSAEGERRWFQWEVAPWRDSNGAVAGLLLSNYDVTALVLAREEAEESQAETRRAHDAAEAANRVKDEFLANMSHEIRTPLNGVLGLAGALAFTALTTAQASMVSTIEESGRDLERMLTGVLELVSADTDRSEGLREVVDVGGLLLDLAQSYAGQTLAKGLELRVEPVASGLEGLRGDEGRIRGVLTRLLDNAVKFTATGWISLGVELGGLGEKVEARFTVHDTGAGFDPALAERIFDRFQQADGSVTRRFGGSGLGLAVCRALAAGMGGRVEAYSTPGAGSVFTLVVPLERAGRASLPAEMAA